MTKRKNSKSSKNKICNMRKIRDITVRYGKEDSRNFIFIMSSLSWDRIESKVQFLANTIPDKSKVLELGCGCGHTTAMLSVIRQDIKIIGTDIMEAWTWKHLEKFGCSFAQCDATHLPFGREEFDVIVSFGVVEHVENNTKFFKEIYRCLKINGYNIIYDLPNKYSLSEFFAKILDITHHENKYTKGEIISMLNSNRFKVMSIKREYFIPAEIQRISRHLGTVFNKFHRQLFNIDNRICKTPFFLFCQNFRIVTQKSIQAVSQLDPLLQSGRKT